LADAIIIVKKYQSIFTAQLRAD